MKKLSLFLFTIAVMLMSCVCVHAADFTVKNTTLPSGTAYENYSAQIEMLNGNEGYSFEFVSGLLPAGITINSDGSVTGKPTSAGYYGLIGVSITHTDGTSKIVTMAMHIELRPVNVTVEAPQNVVYDGQGHTATVRCYDVDGKEMDEAVISVYYGSSNLKEAVNAGSYYMSVYVSGCRIKNYTGDKYLEIAKSDGASISISGDKAYPYDQQPHPLTASDITVSPSGISYAVEYSRSGGAYTTDEPLASGVYTVKAYTTDPNYVTAYATSTIKIEGSTINFDVTNTEFAYDGSVHKPTITPSVSGIDYTVTYTNANGGVVENPIAAGVYTITITLADASKYSIGNDYVNKFTITPKSVTCDIGTVRWDYDGTSHSFSGVVENVNYSVQYRLKGTDDLLTSITDVGEYDIIYVFNDPSYVADSNSPTTAIIDPITIDFTVSDNVYNYDGNPHTATVTPSNALANGHYTVKYTRLYDVNPKLEDAPTKGGEYKIVVTFGSDNFVLGNVSDNLVIWKQVTVNLGNSPVAMIYRDDTQTDEWKENALQSLKANKEFVDGYIPDKCVANIKYEIPAECAEKIKMEYGTQSPEFDKYTVIATSTDSFVDPGVEVFDGEETTVYKKTSVDEMTRVSADENIYVATYDLGGQSVQRTFIFVGRLGDVNYDNAVNNIDVNSLIDVNETANTFVKARMWDVDKDGTVDSTDKDAIKNRFKTPILQYYPWLYK